MTDSTALCARLRAIRWWGTRGDIRAAADLIESQAREIEELRNKHKDHLFALLNAHNTRVATLESRNAALEEALRPFADRVFNDNGELTVDMHSFTYEEIVAAYFAHRKDRAALAKEKPSDA